LAGGRDLRPLRKPGDVGIAMNAAAASEVVAMVTAEHTRAAVGVDSRRAVT